LAYLFISLLFFLFASDRIISQVGHIKDKMTLRNGCAYDGEHERKEEKENEKEKLAVYILPPANENVCLWA
jgi:hypothetical protein